MLRKIIGARYYRDPNGDKEFETPRDIDGHGTHVAAIAVGVTVPGVSYYGVAAGTARGGSPESRLAIYQVCFKYECPGSAILAAFDDCIHDGVDVISVSIGGIPGLRSDLKHDPIAIGSFHAVERGILVAASAGNSGPTLNTVVNDAPWVFSVAASSIDRDFKSNLVFGDSKVIKVFYCYAYFNFFYINIIFLIVFVNVIRISFLYKYCIAYQLIKN